MAGSIKALAEMVQIQSSPGNFDADPYNFGFANGLVLALATILGMEPVFLAAPATWLRDIPGKPPGAVSAEEAPSGPAPSEP